MASGAVAVAPEATGMPFNCSNLAVDGSKESSLAAAIPQLVHLPAALRAAYGPVAAANGSVSIRRSVGLPRTAGGADVVHSHPAFFGREHYNQVLEDVAYQGVARSSTGADVMDVYFAQVIAVCTLDEKPFVFCRGYAADGTAAESVVKLQPLKWEQLPRRAGGAADAGVFMALDVATLLFRACVVPDFERGDGHFFVNHLVHEAEAHLPKELNIQSEV